MRTPTNKNISFNDYQNKFKTLKETTTTSSLGRHLGHHCRILVSDGEQYEDNEKTSAI